MKNFITFLVLGLLTAAVGEWQFSVFLRSDLPNFLGSLFFNTLYLSAAFFITLWMLPLLRQKRGAIWWYVLLFGNCGLLVEWFLIGNSPWGNPQASQAGMFAYWACMVLLPLVFLMREQTLYRSIWWYVAVYVVLALLGQGLISSPVWRFAYHIYLVIIGYLGLMLMILLLYDRRFRAVDERKQNGNDTN